MCSLLYPARVSFSSCQQNLIKTFQIEAMIALITKMLLIFSWDLLMTKTRRQKVPKSDFQSWFSMSKTLQIFLKKNSVKNINLGATFLFLSILSSIKIERLLLLKFLKMLAFFDSYFWPFNKTHEKIIAILVISAIMASIWNVFYQIPLTWWKN